MSLSLHFGPRTASGGEMPAAPGHRGDGRTLCAHPALLFPGCKGVKAAAPVPPSIPRSPRASPGPGAPAAAAPSPRRGAEAETQKSNFTIAY